MQPRPIDRRQWIKTAGLTGAAAVLGGGRVLGAPTGRRRMLRVAHVTDVHVEPERGAGQGMAACLDHLHAQADRPELILFGGDCVFDSMAHDAARTRSLWDLWQRTLKDHCSIPAQFAIGNHDVFGWNHARAHTTGTEPLYGKRWAMQQLGLERPYHSFDRGGWHFVVLDSIFPNGDAYQARLDEPQLEWLTGDLAAVPAGVPTLVLSHVPILSTTAFIDPKSTVGTDTTIGCASMHEDFRQLRDLFRRHPTVKVALSGHTHLLDRVDSLGVSYVCGGAVSGNWWKGDHLGECQPGYNLLDLYDDGTFDHRYVTYGWTTVPGNDPA